MSIKTLVLAAAVAATGSIASADNYFEFGETLDRSSIIDLGLVRAESAGVVEIYDNARGELGQLLGTETVNGGANADVRVNLGSAPQGDVIAVIRVNGEIAETKSFDVN